MWNVYSDTIRTNNSVEGWHHKLNCDIGRSDPNVHKLVDFFLRKEQASTETTNQQALLGVAPPPRRRKYQELDCRLQRVRLSYELHHGSLPDSDPTYSTSLLNGIVSTDPV